MTHGHLWDRLAEAKSRLAPVQSKYRVVFEDPAQTNLLKCLCLILTGWLVH
jgi:hypothetical protein